MTESGHGLSVLIFLVGVVTVASIFIKAGLERAGMPALVGFMALGFGLRLVDDQWEVVSTTTHSVFVFLSKVGVVCLLFRVGLESHLAKLLAQLRRATVVWLGDVSVSGIAGFAATRWLLGQELVPSLMVATACTATSVAVSTWSWREAGALGTTKGQLLVDVAELDDLSGILLMSLLFAAVPALQAGGGGALGAAFVHTVGLFLVHLLVFGGVCFLFSRYAEARFSRFFQRLHAAPSRMLVVVGTGFMIAALAGLLDFSLAIGAFFAGLLFSRDPRAVRTDTSFESVYELFVPFFFIGLGMDIEPESFQGALGWGALLFVAAAAGKVLGAGLAARRFVGGAGALQIGVSMVPRAEIALLVMQQGLKLGAWAVPPKLYSAMAIVGAVSCLAVPWFLPRLLQARRRRSISSTS